MNDTDYSKMSDLEININVAELLHPGEKFTAAYSFFQPQGPAVQWICGYAEYIKADYCNKPEDAWPVITKYKINIEFHQWKNDITKPYSLSNETGLSAYSDNPLRAAMIVFLKMQDSKNISERMLDNLESTLKTENFDTYE